MAFCVNCGNKLKDNEKFCTNCGQAVAPHINNGSERKTIYNGSVYKCPNCGEVIESFTPVCPSCDYEIRDTKVSDSVQQFYWNLNNAKTAEEKALKIRNYPIPNSKEDIIEFMILASSNISGESNTSIFEAWNAKFEQAYQKAQITLLNDAAFAKVKEIYEKTEKTIMIEKISHTTASAGNLITKYFNAMPNPVFAVVLALLLIFNLIRLFNGQFAGMDIIFDAIILGATYGITNKRKKK